jgi:hypothetical protein
VALLKAAGAKAAAKGKSTSRRRVDPVRKVVADKGAEEKEINACRIKGHRPAPRAAVGKVVAARAAARR